MDPTAPNNNQPNSGNTTPPNPIQPGQFVVAGEDQQPTQNSAPAAPQATQDPAPPQPAVSLAGERQESAAPLPMPTAPAANGATQPDPTPFTAPGIGQQSTPEKPKGGGSKMIIIIFAVVMFLAIIGAVVYFFVLPGLKSNAAKNQTSTDVQVEEPSSPPPNTGTGFGDIPDSTESAQQAPPADTGAPATQTTPATTESNP